MRILIVEDSRVMRQIVTRTLRQAGFTGHDVIEAADGRRGLELAQAEAPEVIMSDWNMPELTGLELLQTLRARGHQATFGFITVECTPDMRQLAEDAGAAFFIVKPFTAERFNEVLSPVLR